MNKFHEILNELKSKYANPIDSDNFKAEFNKTINSYYANPENYNSFKTWLEKASENLDLELNFLASTFFPSLSFTITHEIIEFEQFTVIKEEIFCISFIEDYFTSSFISYMRETKEKGNLTYKPRKRPERDSKFDENYNRIIKEINMQFPEKIFLDIKFTDYLIGDYQLTYSTQPKTSIFELLFRSKLK